ncbi:energy transducer TonB [Microvirga sp. STR05]|uniref:Energy transducer TonB n=1 Tax=Hymenobacter duratus TaxID=2771356 RepID=A0ABR8JIY1_9BACT|nr:energy transducer TonB [Hymenobacter duratus]MBD2715563.1 energy transducer TonB [Hymenobacter duratus]MBR7950471.1 energy transducer TonB [Microvirga sp. STR05]
MKHLFFLLLLVASGPLALAQQPAPPTKQPIELKAGRMQAQARPAANRPDVAPQYVGGAQAMGAFFQENIKYPEAARVKGLTGNVEVTATVGADGRLSNPVVAKSLSPECDAEALRVLALMPAWKPATRKGEPVPVQVRLPVPFANGSILQVEQGKTKFE